MNEVVGDINAKIVTEVHGYFRRRRQFQLPERAIQSINISQMLKTQFI
jgi:hypothetical protein